MVYLLFLRSDIVWVLVVLICVVAAARLVKLKGRIFANGLFALK